MSFKILHSFVVEVPRTVEEVSTETKNGQTITIKSQVSKKVPYTIVLKEPTRRNKADLGLFYGKTYSVALTEHGLVPRALVVQKFLKDPNSPLHQDGDKNVAKMYEQLGEIRNDYLRIKTLPDSDENKTRVEELSVEYSSLQRKVMDIESSYQSLFANTAESYAQNRMISWLVLMLSYIQKEGSPVASTNEADYRPMFDGKDFDKKEEVSYDLEEKKDDVFLAAIEKLSSFWGLYAMGQVSSAEGFKAVEEEYARLVKAGDATEPAKEVAESATEQNITK
jgi:hypothetical protein